MIDITDLLIIAICIVLIIIALLLACAVAIALARNAGIVRRGAACAPSPAAVADDPFFHPFGEMPTVPPERRLLAGDFRAWGIPAARPFTIRDLDFSASAGALRRNESGGRPSFPPGTAVVLTFPKRSA